MDNENNLEMVRYVPVTRRIGLDQGVFDQYWSDVHGPMVSAIPNLHLYTQFHLGPNQPDHWLSAEGVDTLASKTEIIDGIAECGFVTGEQFERWLGDAQCLMDDEQNCFDGTYGYYTLNSGSHTIKSVAVQGARGMLSVVALVRRRVGIDDSDFRSFVQSDLTDAFRESEHCQRFRYHLLEPYEGREAAWRGHIVKSHIPEELRHHAAVEFIVENRLALRRLFESPTYKATLGNQAKLFSAVHAYPVNHTVNLVRGGVATLDGRRGWTTAELIRNIGAVNAA